MIPIKCMDTGSSYATKYVRPSCDEVKAKELRKWFEEREKLIDMKRLPEFKLKSNLSRIASDSTREAIQIANSSKSSRFFNLFKKIGKYFKFVK